MKLLVFAHRLEYGGTQVNAIELAAALRDRHGHEVVLFATPGPMLGMIERLQLRYIAAPDARLHPSPTRMRALRAAVRAERPDLLHIWDWWQCLEAYAAVHLPMRIPMVVTDMMMELTRVLPKGLPTTFGVPALVDEARRAGRHRAQLLLPPVDTDANAPGAVSATAFRERHALHDGDINLVTVSRLADFMKSESLLRTIDVVRQLGTSLPLRLVIVGDGTARPRLQQLADETNAGLGREAVTLAGPMLDPRPAYAAADVVIGMGGSALRGMAFGKPVVVVGVQGFSALFDADSAPAFLHQGLFGRGQGDPGNQAFAVLMRRLASQPEQFSALGDHARQFVLEHFALDRVSRRLSEYCVAALAEPPRFGSFAIDALRTAAVYLRERRFATPSRDRLVPVPIRPGVGKMPPERG